MSAASTLAAALESALDFYLKQQPEALARSAALTGRCIAITLVGTGITLYFRPDAEGIQVLSQYEGDVDTQISGSPLGFARLKLDNREDALFQGTVQIHGDTDIGQQFQDILGASGWDWEEQLSHITGDVIAHQAGRLLDRVKRFARDSAETLRLDSSEYLQEEARLLPTRVEVDYFLSAVDTLRADLDRLEARIARLLNIPESGA
jgi:ubiquinone biosynthesis protein UbiJ